MSKSTLTARLLAASGLGPVVASAAADPAAPAPNASGDPAVPAGLSAEAETEVTELLKATSTASEAKGLAAGVAQERERTAAVFASPEALANPKLAAFMLTETDASAEKVIEGLKGQGPAAAPAAAAPAPAPAATPAQPSVAGMAAATPVASRDPGNEGEADEETDLSAVFPGVDFTGKSSISEDNGAFSTLSH